MSVGEHKQLAEQKVGKILVSVVTVSDTRTEKTDRSGHAIQQLIADAGHEVISQTLIPDEPISISQELESAINQGARCIIFTGGTGLSPRDITLDTLQGQFEKTIDGFGELFRFLSYQEVGPAAMLSRAGAGIIKNTLVFALPGSTNAVNLAMRKLIIPELRHMISQIDRA